MNDLQTTTTQLPDTIEDLSRFVLVNEERLQALRAEIRAIKKVHLAKEVYEQKLAEAQEIGQITVEAAQKMGELLLQIQTAQGKRTDLTLSGARTKSQRLEEMGMTRQLSNEYEQMAQNPDAVQTAIQKAIENGDVVSRSQVMKEIRALKEELAKAREQKPEIKRVEVFPDDYNEKSAKARAYDAETGRLNRKLEDAYRERNELAARVHELESATKEGLDNANLSENIVYFCTICNNFIGNVGGLVWLTDRINDMPKGKKEMFLKAAYSFRDWAEAFSMNLERRMNEHGKPESDAGIPLLPD